MVPSAPKTALFLAAFCALLFSQGGVGPVNDGRAMLGVAEAMAVDGTLALTTRHQPGYTVLSPEGRVHSKFGLGESLLLAPAVWTVRVVSLGGADAAEVGWIQWLMLHVVPSALGALAFVACVGLGLALGWSAPAAMFGAGAAILGTPAIVYFRNFYSEGALVLLVMVSLWGMALLDRRKLSIRQLAGLGFVAGFAVLVKASGALVLGTVGLFVLWRRERLGGWKPLLSFAAGAALPVSAALVYNHLRTGNPIGVGYGEGVDAWGFSTPVWEGLWGLIASPGKGAMWFAPSAIVGAWAASRVESRAWRGGLAIIAGGFVLAAATWWAWHGGECWGPRLILPALVPLAVFSGKLWEDGGLSRKVAIVAALVGLGVNGLGVGVHWVDHYDRVPHETWAETMESLAPGESLPIEAKHNLASIHENFSRPAIPAHAWLLGEVLAGKEGRTGAPWSGEVDSTRRPLLMNWWPIQLHARGQMGVLQWLFLGLLGVGTGLYAHRVRVAITTRRPAEGAVGVD